MANALSLMKSIQHVNVSEIWGICIEYTDGPAILHEFMKYGNLHGHLVRLKNQLFLDFTTPLEMVRSY